MSHRETILALSPVAYWRLDESSGNFADHSGNGNTEVNYGGTTDLTYNSTGLVSDGDGAILIGANPDFDFHCSGSTSLLVGDNFTFMAWFSQSGATAALAPTIMQKGSDTDTGAPRMYCPRIGGPTATTFRLALRIGSVSGGDTVCTSSPLNLSQTYFGVVTKNGSSAHVYINGTDDTVAGTPATATDTPAFPFDFGSQETSGGTYWRGTIDEAVVFNYALSAAQVAAVYAAAISHGVTVVSTTLKTIREDFVEEFGMGRVGSATSATTTTLVDNTNFGGDEPVGQFPNGSPIRITSGAAIGSKTRLRGLDPSTGTITIPTVTGNTGTPSFIISKDVDSIDRFDEALNRALTRSITRWQKVPLTAVPDGDFLGGTVTDFWTGTSATPTYSTMAMVNQGIAQRVLNVVTSGTNGYAQSTTFGVRGGEVRQGYVMMRANAASSTAELIIRDITNSAAITPTFSIGSATTTSRSFVNVRYQYTVPSTCTQVAYRLNGQESGATVQFGWLIDMGENQRTYATQAYLQSYADLGSFYILQIDGRSTSRAMDNAFITADEDGLGLQDFGWGTSMEFDAVPPFGTFYEVLTYYPALTADTDTTDCPEDIAIAGMAYELFKMLEGQELKKPETGGASRWTVLLARAEAQWKSPTVQRRLARRKVNVSRTYRPQVYA